MQRKYTINGEEFCIDDIRITDETISFILDGKNYIFDVITGNNGYFTLKHDNDATAYHGYAANADNHGTQHIFMDGLDAFISHISGRKDANNQNTQGALTAPMPGKVIEVMVKENEAVEKGAPLLIMEAMKLQHSITAPRDAIIKTIHCTTDAQIQEDSVLITLQDEDDV